MKEQKLHLRRKKNERDKESSYLWVTSLHMWHKPEEITILVMPFFFRFYFVSILFILISYNNLFLYKNKLLYINSLHYFFLVICKM